MNAEEMDRVVVGRYLRRDQAEDRSLVLLAMGIHYWIIPDEGLYALIVKERDADAASRELIAYEAERREERELLRDTPPPVELGRISFTSLFFYVWVMVGYFHLQSQLIPGWTERGMADSALILQGEWWRVVTALTLHADSGHLVANIGVGVLFAWALLPVIGTGWTWFGFVISGALGNAINAWGFRGESHHSIGASTAVFGALGMLVGWQIFQQLHMSIGGGPRQGRGGLERFRELIIPVAAGLALLAYLGTGGGNEESRVDLTAHLFGMVAGGLIGTLLAWTQLPQRTPPWAQAGLALVAISLPVAAWLIALWT